MSCHQVSHPACCHHKQRDVGSSSRGRTTKRTLGRITTAPSSWSINTTQNSHQRVFLAATRRACPKLSASKRKTSPRLLRTQQTTARYTLSNEVFICRQCLFREFRPDEIEITFKKYFKYYDKAHQITQPCMHPCIQR